MFYCSNCRAPLDEGNESQVVCPACGDPDCWVDATTTPEVYRSDDDFEVDVDPDYAQYSVIPDTDDLDDIF
jgi:uncharacterized Zn finger protein (UPF0148 family)